MEPSSTLRLTILSHSVHGLPKAVPLSLAPGALPFVKPMYMRILYHH